MGMRGKKIKGLEDFLSSSNLYTLNSKQQVGMSPYNRQFRVICQKDLATLFDAHGAQRKISSSEFNPGLRFQTTLHAGVLSSEASLCP